MSEKLTFNGLESNEKKDAGSNADNHKELEESWADFKSYNKKKKKKKKAKKLKKKNKKLKKQCKHYRKQKKHLKGENSVMQNNHTYLEQRVSEVEHFIKLMCFRQLIDSDDRAERKRLASTMTRGGQL